MTGQTSIEASGNRESGYPRVALVNDDRDFAAACSGELALAGFQCEHFRTAESLLVAVDRGQSFPLLLMDIVLPGEDPYAAIAQLLRTSPPPAIVVLTGAGPDQGVFLALRAGAVGYVLKSDAVGRLGEVLREVVCGGAPMSPSIARRVVGAFRPHEPDFRLTARELDVLRLLARGLSYADTAGTLVVSLDTVRSHVRKIYEKLHVANKAEAVARAMRVGLLT